VTSAEERFRLRDFRGRGGVRPYLAFGVVMCGRFAALRQGVIRPRQWLIPSALSVCRRPTHRLRAACTRRDCQTSRTQGHHRRWPTFAGSLQNKVGPCRAHVGRLRFDSGIFQSSRFSPIYPAQRTVMARIVVGEFWDSRGTVPKLFTSSSWCAA